jgi:hypothetical protein
MKTWHKRTLLIAAIVTLLAAGILWSSHDPAPSITFVGLRDTKYGPVAAFRIDNRTRAPLSLYGYDGSSPFYTFRVPSGTGWQVQRQGWCGTGAGRHSIPPRSSVEFTTHLPPNYPGPFAVGVHLERTTPNAPKTDSETRLTRLKRWVLSVTGLSRPDADYTWSDVVRT